jgi:ethanolaminephosphotransferase
LTGLCLVVANLATMVYYDPNYLTEKGGATGPPNWIYFTCAHAVMKVKQVTRANPAHSWAIGLFMYQSLDAIDGKQARRTGMAGPLGEMFDHGMLCR